METAELIKKSAQIRVDSLKIIHKSGMTCAGDCMSSIELLTALYYGEIGGRPVINCDPGLPGSDEQDYFVLSKIGATPALYSILADKGFFDKSDLNFVGKEGCLLNKCPNAKVPGICASVLANGLGLSMAVGLALSLKMEKKYNRVYCLLGSHELLLGKVWSALNVASHYMLDNLVVILDEGHTELDFAEISAIRVDRIQDKLENFGWRVVRSTHGHDFDNILDALYKTATITRRPICICANTIAGFGVELFERKHCYLDATISEGEMSHIISNLEMNHA